MAIDLKKDVLLRVRAETRDATKNIGTLGQAIEDVSKRFTSMNSKIDATPSAFAKMAAAAKTAFGGIAGSIGAGIGAIDRFGKSLAPWNQALELGGKVVRFASEGMDAYAKTSDEAAAKVKKLKDEFGGLRDDLKAGAGAITVGIIEPLGIADAELKKINERIEQTRARLKSLGMVVTEVSSSNFGWVFKGAEVTHAIDDVSGAAKNFYEATLGGVNRFGEVDAMLEQFKKGMDESAAATKKAATEALRYRLELAAIGGKLLGNETAADRAIRQGAADRAAFQAGVDADVEQMYRQEAFDRRSVLGDTTLNNQVNFSLDTGSFASADQLQAMRDHLLEVQKLMSFDTQESILKRLGMPEPEEWDFAIAGAQAFSNALGPSLQALAEGTMSAGEIFKKGVGTIVKSIGDQLAAHAAAEFVTGGAMAITLNPKAALHLAAGGIYSAGAVAAYATASKLGAGSGSAPAKSGGGASAGQSASSGSGGSSSSSSSSSGRTEPMRPQIYVLGSHFDELSPRQRALEAERAMRRAKQSMDE